MGKALIVFASRTGETKKIGELIAEGIRISGMEAVVKNVNDIKSEADLKGFDALVLGSATYHGKMIQSMEKLLFLGEKAELENKVGGSFGAFGWSGEAPDRIFDTMANIFKMKMASAALRLKSSSLGGGIAMAQNYGREIGTKMAG
ncbi:MAG: flavodoxin domain-containing protein [Pseudomonadota bacterium]